jgi:hypothetical protein
MKVRTLLIALLATAGGLASAAPASAHPFPENCDSNSLDLNLTRDRLTVKNGDVINYMVRVNNISDPGTIACQVSNITLRLEFPGADGQPSGVFQTVVANATYASEAGVQVFGPFPYTVAVSDSVKQLVARVSFENGVLHSSDDHTVVNDNRTIDSYRPTPAIEVDKTADIKAGLAPQNVTYSFRVYNRTVPSYPLENVTLTDNQCPGVVKGVPFGDTDGDNKLDVGEVWLYTCTMPHGVGVFTNTATACGELIISSGPLPKVCDTDDETVEFTPPPGNPPVVVPPVVPPAAQGGVKPVSAAQAPCTLARATKTTVRAGQLNTIRVRVRNVDAGTTVRITLPGGKVVSAKADKNGLATFKVKPTKSGTASIRAAECSAVERFSVKAARRVVAQRAPRVTG